ncbi:AzlD domain-containing protein [Periweissella beninensis]|uniref:AzlD domain-containing protein n=1 Tax=Periweissella beninensis TaxID=504936 RepID=A0ABT0VIL7_9LACO|nr:AzlD domain-containing protein [Periweissella beninensis]MBM7543956.1 branched-subunit amino acid transport protein [Periweissella beninensis]MCM2437682.1 AzlD domain-containing protein [Periweissella beninensis]MCT4396125.1 AzlD domain-containing protein [Periweissella beninensis]
MDTELKRHLMIVGFGAIAAFIPRYFPMLFFTTRKVPAWFNEWMNFVPVSLFTALIAKDIFVTHDYQMTFSNFNMMLAAIIVVIVAYYTHSMLLSVLSGLVSVWGFALLLATFGL